MRIKHTESDNELDCLFGADGKPIPILGEVTLSVGIEGLRIPGTFLVVKNLSYPMILGIDFLQQNQAVIDTNHGVVTFCDELVAAPFIRRRPEHTAYVRAANSFTIPPLSEAVVQARIDSHYRLQTSIVEPFPSLVNRNVALAKSIVSPSCHFIVCRLLNPTSSSVFFKEGSRLGCIEPIEVPENDMNNLNLNAPDDQPTQASTKPKFSSMQSADQILSELGIKLDKTNFSQTDFQTLSNFLVANKDIFATSLADLTCTNVLEHKIETVSEKPIRQRVYRTTPENRAEINRQCDEMLKLGLISESQSPWSAPVILVNKAGSQEKRFVIDYRKLNDVTIDSFHPLPTMDEVLDTLADKQPKIFTTLDLKSGFFQVPLAPESRDKTAFSTQSSHYSWNVMPNGLRNAPATFQSLMTSVLRNILFKYCLCYVDDILVFSPDIQTHILHLDEIFKKLRNSMLKLHVTKCRFAIPEVKYLGHIISKNGLSADPSKVAAVQNFPRPTNLKTVRGFLGMAGYYRKFIKDFAKIAHPIHQLLKKSEPFVWSDACEDSFNKLKLSLTTAPVLIFPDLNKDFVVVTDASKTSLGFYLTQEGPDGKQHPVSYSGRAVRAHEKTYTTTELELLAIMSALKHYHNYIANRFFTVVTDHVSLKYISSLKLETGRIARWALYLMNYNFKIVHMSGAKNVVADALSRREYSPCPQPERTIEEDFEHNLMALGELVEDCDKPKIKRHKSLLVTLDITDASTQTNILNVIEEGSSMHDVELQDIISLQRECPDFQPMFDYLEQSVLPQCDKAARKLIIESEFYEIIDGRMFHLHHPRDKSISQLNPLITQLCIPRALRQDILTAYHDNNQHLGFDRLYTTVRQKYYWQTMHKDMYTYVQGCANCQASKINRKKKNAPSSPIAPPGPLQRWSLDLYGPLPTSPEGYKYVLVCLENFSRFPECFLLKTTSALELATVIYEQLIVRWGVCKEFVSDLGSNLTSGIFKSLATICGITHKTTSSFHPQGNSLVERFMSNITQSLRLYCDNQQLWPRFIPSLLYSYRSTVAVNTTKLSPFQILLGQPMLLPIDVTLLPTEQFVGDAQTFAKDLIDRLALTEKVIKKNIVESQEKNKVISDRKAEMPKYEVGSKVWLKNMARKPGQNHKICKPYLGPYFIVQKGHNNLWFKLRHAVTDKLIKNTVFADRLKPFVEINDEFYTKTVEAKQKALEREAKSQKKQLSNGLSSQAKIRTAAPALPTLRAETTPPSVTPPLQDTLPMESDTTPDDWLPIKRIIRKRGRGKDAEFLVMWDNAEKTCSWCKPEDVTDYTKIQFYKAQAKRRRRYKC